ncbi:diacylglycerol kinase family protein [Virgibacillus flavescens]|uniref:diacylglycerol kinase family protein n=1 Tax=Virgibacillus flavescens TaxID=1611422 RepID=UPI003D325393
MRSSSEDKRKKKSIGFSFAMAGLIEVIKNERNFRLHLIAAVLACILGILVELSSIEWMIILLVIGIVLVAETTNSAIERLIDYLRPEMHPSAKIIKDIAAGAVLLSACLAFIIGCIVFIPKVYQLLIHT